MLKQTFTSSATSRTERDTAWQALDAPSTWEGIGGVHRVTDAVVDDNGRLVGFSFESLIGNKPYPGKASARERVEGSKMSWDISSSEVRGVTRVTLSDDENGGTRVEVTLELESAGFLGAMLFPMIVAAVGQGLGPAVEEFAESLGELPRT